jgi:O-antigen/teichoic acid export membrane protein
VSRFLNYLLTPLYTYIFSREAYGDVVILYAYVTFLAIILTYGLETGFFYFAKKEKDFAKVYGTAFLSILTTTLIFVGIAFVFLPHIAVFLNYQHKVEYIIWFIFILGIDSLTAIPFAKLRQQNKAFKFAMFKLLNVIITMFFNVLLLWIIPHFFIKNGLFLGIHYKLDVVLIFIANFIGSFCTLILLLPDLFKEKIRFSFELWHEMFKYSYPLLFVGLIGTINETLDRILLQKYLPASVNSMAQIGIYGACVKIAVIMTLFTQMFRFAAEPYFFNRKNEDQKTILADVSKYFILYGLVIFVGVMSYIDVLKYFVGPEFREGTKIVAIYLLGSLGLGIYFNLSFWYKLNGKTYYGIIISAVGALITIILNIVFIPYFSYVASAWSRFICYFVIIIISYLLGQKYYRINYPVKVIAQYFGLSIILFLIITYLRVPNTIIDLIKNTLIFGAFIYYMERKEQIITIFYKSK